MAVHDKFLSRDQLRIRGDNQISHNYLFSDDIDEIGPQQSFI